tara:strand:- start:4814 stop:5257 length:444 start_codon:yes stop_codon:yes gene_type:complete
MKTIERVFEVLNKEKVELKAEKVELSVADDAKKIISQVGKETSAGDKFLKTHNSNVKNYEKLKKDLVAGSKAIQKNIEQAEKYTNKLNKMFEKTDDVIMKIRRTADELGVPLKSIKVYQQVFDAQKKLGEVINDSDKMLSYSDHLDL